MKHAGVLVLVVLLVLTMATVVGLGPTMPPIKGGAHKGLYYELAT